MEALAELSGSVDASREAALLRPLSRQITGIGYATRMADASPEIILCPPEYRAEALAHILSELAPSQRREIAASVMRGEVAPPQFVEGLWVALREDTLCGAAWGQRQPGNTAVFWPPQLVPDEERATAQRLAESVVADLDRSGVPMSQVLVSSQDAEVVPLLTAIGFRHLADLLYLTCEADRFPTVAQNSTEIHFVPYRDTERNRLKALIEHTYDGTHDCPALNGTRNMDDVLAGYQSTGVFRPENWLIVRSGDADVGVLLLADHPAAQHWELVYMGVTPEARGRGWGARISLHAQWLARTAQVERIVLAVDAANEPALRMYRSVGFESWERRTVFVRFLRDAARTRGE